MQQTIFALGALMMIVMMAVSHQRSTLMMQEVSYVRELENAALDLAKLRVETILNSTGFDENWLNETVLPSSANLMTPSNAFGSEGGEPPFDDVDDYHLVVEPNFLHAIGTDTFRFNITFEVSYVDGVGDTTSASTFAKQLTANVVSADTIGAARVARALHRKTTIISEDL